MITGTHADLHTHTHLNAGPCESHLRLPLLQQGFQSFLCRSALMVITHNQDDVIPLKLTHHVKPHLGLVGIGRYRTQEGEVNALNGHLGKRTGESQRPEAISVH